MSLADALDQEIHEQNISVIRYNLKLGIKAAYFNADSISNPVIILNKNIDITYESNGAKAHELGHHYSCCGNLLEMSPRLQMKYETLANRWALNRAMPLNKIIAAYRTGVRSLPDLIDYLEVSPEFILRGFALYESIYGPELQYKGYTISWDPLNINLTEEALL